MISSESCKMKTILGKLKAVPDKLNPWSDGKLINLGSMCCKQITFSSHHIIHRYNFHFVKKIICLLLILISFSAANAQGSGDPMMAWVKYATSTWGKTLGFELYAKRSSWGLGQQFFAANVKNGVPYKLRVQGELYAKLICGNESVSKLDFTIDSYALMTKADMGSMNVNYLSDATGLLSSADKEECTGSDIIVGGKKVGVNRIQTLGIRNLKVEGQMSKGGDWVPMRSDGTFIEPAANKTATGSASPSGTASSQTFGNNNAQPNSQNANTGSTKQGTQQFNNQQSMPNTSSNGTISSQKAPQSNPMSSNQAILQNMVTQDLLKAQQSANSPILQAMHLGNAKLAAIASGNQAAVNQIGQQQQQMRVQAQQQLVQSTTQLAGTVFNLIAAAQEKKRQREAEMESWRIESEQRENAEALKIAEIEERTAPQKQLELEQLQERMNVESESYGNSSLAKDKLLHAMSWLWKWNEVIKIVGTKPKVKGSYSNPTVVEVLSEGYLYPPNQSLLSAAELAEKMSMSELPGLDIVSKEAPKLLFPIDFPRNAKKFKDKMKFWYPRSREKITEADKIEREYTHFGYWANENFGGEWPYKYTPGVYLQKHQSDFSDIYLINAIRYPKDSASCVQDGAKKFRYWKGSSSKSIYEAGFVTQKKLEAQLLHASLLLDSAIAFNAPATLSRSAAIYRDAFDWYLKGPIRWLKVEYQPAKLIRESMWRYALVVAAVRKNIPSADNTNDPHEALTEAFVQQFEQYLQQPVSQVTEPMKLGY